MSSNTTRDPEPERSILEAALRAAFPDSADAILATPWPHGEGKGPRWDSLCGCWLFQRWGMTIGVERDGYVHS
jgi:hypothetical protein